MSKILLLITLLTLFHPIKTDLVDFIHSLFFGREHHSSRFTSENEAAEERFIKDIEYLKYRPSELEEQRKKTEYYISIWEDYYERSFFLFSIIARWVLKKFSQREYHLKQQIKLALERLQSDPLCHSTVYGSDPRWKSTYCQMAFMNQYFHKRNWILIQQDEDHCDYIDIRKIEKKHDTSHDTIAYGKEARRCTAKFGEHYIYVYLITARHYDPRKRLNSFYVLTENPVRTGQFDKINYFNPFSHRKEVTAYIEQ